VPSCGLPGIQNVLLDFLEAGGERNIEVEKAVTVLVTIIHEETGASHRLGNFKIMASVSNKQNTCRVETGFLQPANALGGFPRGVDGIDPDPLGEEVAKAEMNDELVEGFLGSGAEDRLGESACPETPEQRQRARNQPTPGLNARIILMDKMSGDDFEWLRLEIKPDLLIKAPHREIEEPPHRFRILRREVPIRQEAVEDLRAEGGIVQKGPVPVPENVGVEGSRIPDSGFGARRSELGA